MGLAEEATRHGRPIDAAGNADPAAALHGEEGGLGGLEARKYCKGAPESGCGKEPFCPFCALEPTDLEPREACIDAKWLAAENPTVSRYPCRIERWSAQTFGLRRNVGEFVSLSSGCTKDNRHIVVIRDTDGNMVRRSVRHGMD